MIPLEQAISSCKFDLQPPFSIGMCSHQPERVKEAAVHWQRGLSDLGCPGFPLLAINAKSMAEGYNQILAQCKTEYIILCHHDSYPFPIPTYTMGKRLLERMQTVDLLGWAGSSEFNSAKWFSAPGTAFGSVCNFPAHKPGEIVPIEVQNMWNVGMRPCGTTCWNRSARLVRGIKVMDGYALCARTETARKIGFDEKLTHFHLYDLDHCLASFYDGLRTAICNDIYIAHASMGSYSQPEWVEATKYFLDKYRGKADPVLIETGPAYGQWQSQDARLVLAQLQRFEAFMPDEVNAQELRYASS